MSLDIGLEYYYNFYSFIICPAANAELDKYSCINIGNLTIKYPHFYARS